MPDTFSGQDVTYNMWGAERGRAKPAPRASGFFDRRTACLWMSQGSQRGGGGGGQAEELRPKGPGRGIPQQV